MKMQIKRVLQELFLYILLDLCIYPMHGYSVQTPPIYSGISNSTFQIGTKVLVTQSSPRGFGILNYTISYSQSVVNPKIVVALYKYNILFSTNFKYTINLNPSISSTSFAARLRVLSTNTFLYSLNLQYLVINSQNAFIEKLQFSTLLGSVSTTDYDDGYQYHQQTLIADRVFTSPSNIRYYLPSAPKCTVFHLGQYLLDSTEQIAFGSSCSANFTSDLVILKVYTNDGLILTDFFYSILIYVIPQGRYFGYFQDQLDYAYGNYPFANTSLQYLLISASNFNSLQALKYEENLKFSIPKLLNTAATAYQLFYGITSFSCLGIHSRFHHQFSLSNGSIFLQNATQSTTMSFEPFIAIKNQASFLYLSKVQCLNGYYYDRISGSCYPNFGGALGACALSYVGSLEQSLQTLIAFEITKEFWSEISQQGIFYSGSLATNKFFSFEMASKQNVLLLNKSRNEVKYRSLPSYLNRQFILHENILYHLTESSLESILNFNEPQQSRNNSNETNQQSNTSNNTNNVSNGSNDSSLDNQTATVKKYEIVDAWLFQIKDSKKQIRKSLIDLVRQNENETIISNFSQISVLNWFSNSQLNLMITLNDRFLMQAAITISQSMSQNETNSSNSSIETSFSSSAVNLGFFGDISDEILLLIQQYTNNSNITSSDIFNQISSVPTIISKRLKLQQLEANSFIQQIPNSFEQYTIQGNYLGQLLIDNFIFHLQFNLSLAVFGYNSSVQGQLSLSQISNKTKIKYVRLNFLNYQLTDWKVLDMGIQTVYDGVNNIQSQVFVVSIETNNINYTYIPNFISIDEYNFMEVCFTDKYYENRKIVLTYILSNRQIHVFQTLKHTLLPHFSYNYSAQNQTINYTRIYNPSTKNQQNLNISYNNIFVAEYPYSKYNEFYSQYSSQYFNLSELTVEMNFDNIFSSLISNIGDIGNNIEAPNTIESSAQRVQILANLETGNGKVVSVDLSTNGQYIFLLTNVNLLYVYQRSIHINLTASTPLQTFLDLSQVSSFKLIRLIDIYPHLNSTISNSQKEYGISIKVDDDRGTVYISSDKGNIYELNCFWANVNIQQFKNEVYFNYVKLNIPPEPVPIIPIDNSTNITNSSNTLNETNITNQTAQNITNYTTDSTNDTTNYTIINNTNSSNIFPFQPVQQPQNFERTNEASNTGLSQNSIIIISVLSSVLVVSIALGIYYFFIKEKTTVKINPENARSTMYRTKKQSLQHSLQQKVDEVNTKIDRISSGRTQVGSLMELQTGGSSGSLGILKQKATKIKKTKDYNQGSLQTLKSVDVPPTETAERGLIHQKERVIIFDIEA